MVFTNLFQRLKVQGFIVAQLIVLLYHASQITNNFFVYW